MVGLGCQWVIASCGCSFCAYDAYRDCCFFIVAFLSAAARPHKQDDWRSGLGGIHRNVWPLLPSLHAMDAEPRTKLLLSSQSWIGIDTLWGQLCVLCALRLEHAAFVCTLAQVLVLLEL